MMEFKWKNVDKTHPDSKHYSVMSLEGGEINGMAALRELFQDAAADEMNFVLFSTSGVHGSYATIEEAEESLHAETDEEAEEDDRHAVTFLVVHPRLVSLRYGNCIPETRDDIEFLKKLRSSSLSVASHIGMAE